MVTKGVKPLLSDSSYEAIQWTAISKETVNPLILVCCRYTVISYPMKAEYIYMITCIVGI